MSVIARLVRDQLGKTGSFVLADATENGYTRIHAATGYRRINPFAVENGAAPSEFAAPHVLGDWEGYDQASLNPGSDLAATLGYDSIGLTFARPAGYTRDPDHLAQRAFWRDAGTVLDESATATNPFSDPDGSADLGDGTSGAISSALTPGHYYAVGVRVEWDDSVEVHALGDSEAYAAASGQTPLTGAGAGILVGPIRDSRPTIDDVIQDTDPGSCIAGCSGCVDVHLNVVMEGPSQGTLQRRVDGGSWATIDSGVTAGSASLAQNGLDAGRFYEWRLRYNDVSPDSWSDIRSITTECTLA